MGDTNTVRSWSEVKKSYPADKFIHVLPAEDTVFAHGSPQWRLDVTLVKFDPFDPKDCYAIDKNKQGDQWVPTTVGLTKGALERLCSAADVSILGDRIDDRSDDLFAEFSAMGVLATKGGSIRTQPATKTWNGRLRREVKRREAEKKFDSYASKDWGVWIPGTGKKKARACSAEERELVVSDWFTDEWLREREYGLATAESKCQNRARRAILGLSAKYSVEELRNKEFVVPRWAFEPDMSDPEVKRMVIADGLAAQRRAFLLPADARPPAGAALPPAGAEISTAGEVKALPAPDEAALAAEAEAEAAEEKALAEKREAAEREENPDPFADAVDAEVEDDPAPGAGEEGDDVDLIPDEELSLYLAAAIRNYAGPAPQRVRKAWEEATEQKDYKKLRTVLRHVYEHRKSA